ncbi:ATP-binding protein [Streptomyces sp. NPDC048718]|uniref:sensor histidine kinase n=1 Tax=Streptomyces sp. NPDC048718 TaxID=3365587 RepID=UPI00370FC3C5
MPQLRASAARSDRRDGGRHGRSGARDVVPADATGPAQQPASLPNETRIRPHLLRTSVLPALVVALAGVAAVLITIRSTGAGPTTGLWTALIGAAALAAAAVAAAVLGAERTARMVLDRAEALRHANSRGQSELRTVVEQLRKGESLAPRPALPTAAVSGDALDRLGQELARSHEVAVSAVVQASQLSSSVGNEQKVEVFVNLARRLQSLVHREIQLLDELENEVEDPELLKGLFHIDHLATRIRRHAENLAVLGGAISRRQWSNPVTMTEVLRSSIAEVEQYPRVKLVPPIDGTLRGHAVADVIHLLAELVENATLFSAPHTTVLLRAQYVTAGLAIEVEDRGLGMPAEEQSKMNALLADPDQVNVAHLLQDGRIGLFVVSALARRHGIAVRLQSNIYGGIQAVLVLPQGLLGSDPEGLARREGQAPAQGAQPHVQPKAQTPQIPPQQAQTGGPDTARLAGGPAGAPRTGIPAAAPAPAAAPSVAGQAAAPLPPAAPAPASYRTSHQAPVPAPMAVRHPQPQAAHADNGTGTDGYGAPLAYGDTGTDGFRPPGGGYGDAGTPAGSGLSGVPHQATPAGPTFPSTSPLSPTPPSHAEPFDPFEPGTAHSAPGRDEVRQAPRAGAPGRPDLPMRRAQEHLVPQLRDEPTARRPEEHALHDPGLMAAFQRGIGLAETQTTPRDPLRPGDAHKE